MAEGQKQSPLVEWLAKKFSLGTNVTHKDIDAVARIKHLAGLRAKYGLGAGVPDSEVEMIAAEKAFKAAAAAKDREEKYNREHPDDPAL